MTSKSNTHTTALDSGRLAAIVIGSIVGLLLIASFAFVCKKKILTHSKNRVGTPEWSVEDTSFLQEGKALNADTPRTFSRPSGFYELDSRTYPGVELEVYRTPGEMSSNEETAQELAVPKSRISELPS